MTDIIITEKGLILPETEEIYNTLAEDWNVALGGNMSKEQSTPQGQMITTLTAEVENKNNNLLFVSNQINPKTNSGIWQDAIGYIYFLERKQAESSVVECICNGLINTLIPIGSIIKSENGDLFKSLQNAVITNTGSVLVSFASVEKGLIPVVANTINSIVSVISGWDSVNNPNSGAIGRIIESRKEFEFRRSLSVAKNGKGTIASLYSRLWDITDVLDVYVRNNRLDIIETIDNIDIEPHSVFCVVLGGETKTIAETIEDTIGAGDNTTGNVSYQVLITENNVLDTIKFTRPTSQDITIEVELQQTPTTPFGVEEQIKEIIYNNFYGLNETDLRVRIGEIIYASRFYTGIAQIEGISIISVKIAILNESLSDSVYTPINKYSSLIKDNINVNLVV